MSRINRYIQEYTPKDYGGAEAAPCELDCSLGVNYMPIPQKVLESFGSIPGSELKHYPHNEELLNGLYGKLLDRYSGIAPELNAGNLCLGCGSFDLLSAINLLYANSQRTVMGHAPQFTAYVDNVRCIGARYAAYPLDREKNYRMDAGEFAEMIRRERPELICCENPNNPTGQLIDRGGMEKLIAAAADTDAAIVFDEAYGDYADAAEYSAIPLISIGREMGVDVFVTRTFSKGYGMAGIRIGYAIGPADAVTELKKIVTPFNCNTPARYMALAMLALAPGYAETVREKTREANRALYAGIEAMGGKYRIAHTSPDTPICMLYTDDPGVDLCAALAKAGMAVVSCQTYDNLGKNAVRMMLCGNTEKMLEMLEKADL